MPDRIISAEALITARDGTGGVFEKIGAKLEKLGHAKTSSRAMGDLCDKIDATAKKLAALDTLQAKMSGYAKAREAANRSRADLQAHARAMKQAEKPTAEMERKYTQLQGAASKAAAAMERQQKAMRDAKHAADAFGAPVKKIAAEQERLRGVIESTTKAIERQANAERRLAAIGRGLKHAVKEGSPLIMGGAGFKMLEFTKDAVKEGAEVQHERARMGIGGVRMSATEIAAADRQAVILAAKFPNVTRAQVLENYRETRSVLQDPHETPHLMPTIVRARAAMDALDPTGNSGHDLKHGIKGAELLGRTQDKAFADYLDGFIRARQVMGSTASAEQLGDFAKYTRSSGQLLSNRFLHTTANSLIQEEKGSTAGKMVQQVVKEMTGGFEGYHAAAKEMVRLKLANEDDFNKTKTGEIKGLKPGRHIKDWRLWQSDPDHAVWDKLVPAMEKVGITSPEEQVATARRLFPNGLAADFVAKLILQKKSFQNHSRQYAEAAGLDGADKLAREDAIVGLRELGGAIKTFSGTLTSPVMKDAAGWMDDFAHSIGKWSVRLDGMQRRHPLAAKVAAGGAVAGGLAAGGLLGYGAINALTSGFGLKGSALALDGSAIALRGAAKALALAAGGNGLKDVVGIPPGGGKSPRAKGKFDAKRRAFKVLKHAAFIGTVYETAELFSDWLDDIVPTGVVNPLSTDKGRPYYGKRQPMRRGNNLIGAPPTVAPIARYRNSEMPTLARLPTLADGALSSSTIPAPVRFRPIGQAPAIPSIPSFASGTGFGAGLGGHAITAEVKQPIPVDVTGKVKLEGQGTVSVSVKVDGGSITNQSASSSGNIKVSTGASMPTAKSGTGSSAPGH